MTPAEIGIIVHYYGHVDDHDVVLRRPDNTGVQWFLQQGLLELVPPGEVTSSIYRITARGEVFVEALGTVPLPIQKWVMP